ncbi:hypothetical protein BGZ61DRAFT_11319 [Ilyonectria robusta]|uniref:uncharacterized protein n=1 Tax=Ilyonectria robusta TaxID=1079257 RepID=UPI001E8E874B|nr:uncharacterized protein BGZ61DRAFT_11319 [Ilyonectria robusta]KAH8737237.1 hypothetical protein BGZ61DRAFT_11319 [Ilyonectria robusta]
MVCIDRYFHSRASFILVWRNRFARLARRRMFNVICQKSIETLHTSRHHRPGANCRSRQPTSDRCHTGNVTWGPRMTLRPLLSVPIDARRTPSPKDEKREQVMHDTYEENGSMRGDADRGLQNKTCKIGRQRDLSDLSTADGFRWTGGDMECRSFLMSSHAFMCDGMSTCGRAGWRWWQHS